MIAEEALTYVFADLYRPRVGGERTAVGAEDDGVDKIVPTYEPYLRAARQGDGSIPDEPVQAEDFESRPVSLLAGRAALRRLRAW